MSARIRKPKNRFLPDLRISEVTFARILFCWLNGETYSQIPNLIMERGGIVDKAIKSVDDFMEGQLQLSKVGKETISRQACHNLIGTVSQKVLAREFFDRRKFAEALQKGEINTLLEGNTLLGRFLRVQDSGGTTSEVMSKLFEETPGEFLINQSKTVLALSSDEIDYQNYKALKGARPVDAIENPVILQAMQDRYKRFRGYKASAMRTHVAHHACLFNASGFMNIDLDYEGHPNLFLASDAEKTKFWFDCTTRAVMLLLIQLEKGVTFGQLTELVLNGAEYKDYIYHWKLNKYFDR